MYLCQNDTEIAAQEAWLGHARQYQVDARLLKGMALEAAMPGASDSFIAGMHTPTDGKAEPALAAPAIAEAARDHGAQIFTGTAVRGIEQTGGRISGVVTERGRIACSSVVLAGGAWSRLFAGNAGLDLPQLKVLGSVFRTQPLDGPDVTAAGSVFAFRKRMDGGYSIARRNANTAEITPDHFRLLADFLPRLINNRNEIRLRVGHALVGGTADRPPLVARRSHAVRGRPDPRSETETGYPGGGPRRFCRRRFPPLPACRSRKAGPD